MSKLVIAVVAEAAATRSAAVIHWVVVVTVVLALGSPVDSDCSAVDHGTLVVFHSLLRLGLLAKRYKPVPSRPAGLHIPHDMGLDEGGDVLESSGESLVVDVNVKVTHKQVERVLGRYLLRLEGPVNLIA